MPGDESGWSRRGEWIDTVPASPRPQPRALLDDRYRFEALVGAGGMGQVYRAHDLELGEPVAVKLLAEAASAPAIERLRNEVRLARRVTHENVVRVHDLGVPPGGPVYLTMELVNGPSLREVLAGGPVPTAEAASLARQICDGLDAAHRAGVVHSDLKPANVVVAGEPGHRRALLTDFGIARALEASGEGGVVAGTPGYMAPEQEAGGPLGAWTDVYALGLVVFELFTGARLLPRPGDPDATTAADDREQAVDRARAALPAPVGDAVAEALAIEPARRPPSVRTLARALAVMTGAPDPADKTPAGLRLAVLPFRVLGGDGADDFLGAGLAEELARVLAASRGLTLIRGPEAGASPAEDPRALGQAARADAVVAGTVERAGERVRVRAELVEIASGERLAGERFDGTIADVFAFEESMASRISEALRVAWLPRLALASAPGEVAELYLRARRQLRSGVYLGPDGCLPLLERCVELAPRFEPPIALRAICCAKVSFLPSSTDGGDWLAEARAAAALSLERAPGLAESHIAAGMVAAQDGDYTRAVAELARALDLAPTSADAHNYLGRLAAEAGRIDAAMRHLELALSIDPSLEDARFYPLRHRVLCGDLAAEAELWQFEGALAVTALQMLMRMGAWRGDLDQVRRATEVVLRTPVLAKDGGTVALVGRYLLGELDPDQAEHIFDQRIRSRLLSARIKSNAHQVMTEAHLVRGETARALRHLADAAAAALLDVEWLTRCPLLDAERDTDVYRAALRAALARAEALWRI